MASVCLRSSVPAASCFDIWSRGHLQNREKESLFHHSAKAAAILIDSFIFIVSEWEKHTLPGDEWLQ